MKKIILILAVVIVLVLAYWLYSSRSGYQATQSPTPTPSPSKAVTASPKIQSSQKQYFVDIQNFSFSPAELQIKAGDKVVWRQKDTANHIVFRDGLFESALLNTGDEFSFAFNSVGEYIYYCKIHPTMTGKITVK